MYFEELVFLIVISMPHRPRQHQLEDLARAELHRIFSSNNCTVEDLTKDYGEDLLVRIFSENQTTPLVLFVQSKATDKVRVVLKAGKSFIAINVSTSHILHWQEFWQPVVLAVFDAASGFTYWDVVQDLCPKDARLCIGSNQKTKTLYIPIENILDSQGVRRVSNRTRFRFERYLSHKEGAQIITQHIFETMGLVVEYDPEVGILVVPKGKFLPDESGGMSVVTFGRTARMLQRMTQSTGLSVDEVMRKSFNFMQQVTSVFEEGKALQVRAKDGKVKEEWKNAADFFEHLKRSDAESDEV